MGDICIGGENPIRVQSMTTTPTLDTESSVKQVLALAEAGAELVRLTAQGVAHAANLENIRHAVRDAGVSVPLVADIHFNPAAAAEAARHVEKVRINPGNFYDPGRTFRKMEFTDEEYAAELQNIHQRLKGFLDICRANNTAIRIGVNHGSLSDRIMSRYGDGPAGMVESAMEFLRICKAEDFKDVVVSIKASDVPTMTETVRLLVHAMDAEGLSFPLHLGVTEAGNADEGRVKSAVGIGSLLADGIGDTIRVSLSEDPTAEIPVARKIIKHIESLHAAAPMPVFKAPEHRPMVPAFIAADEDVDLIAAGGNRIAAVIEAAENKGSAVKVRLSYPEISDEEDATVAAAIDLGYLLLSGKISGVSLDIPVLGTERTENLFKTIVQASGLARFKAEIVACPGCGRTLFDLPAALELVKEACGHLKQLKIAVMGCIVNGPGEMAGADYGYVGAASGRVSIYRGIEPVYRNVSSGEALDLLIDLIKSDGRWEEPVSKGK